MTHDAVGNRPPHPHRLPDDMGLIATACGIVAAVGYMAANICLRSVTHLDPIWVSCLKALPTVVGVAPILLKRVASGQIIFPSLRTFLITLAAAGCGQLAGNVCFQWSLGVIGIALAVPLNLGAMIVSGALLGRGLLGDRVSPQMALAAAVLMVAILVLSLGAQQANETIETALAEGPTHLWRVVAGVMVTCVSGVAYSLLGVALRYASNRGTPLASLLFTVGLVGLVLLGGLTAARSGTLAWEQTSRQDVPRLLAAGLFNLVAFWALTKALQLSSVLFVNALNASQIAMAAVAGVMLFQEPLTPAMIIGAILTMGGLMLMRGRRPAEGDR